MFVALWEYEVKPGCEKRFEKLRDPSHLTIYLTLDFWNSGEAYEKFMAKHGEEYKALDTAGAKLTSNERRLGWYELVEP